MNADEGHSAQDKDAAEGRGKGDGESGEINSSLEEKRGTGNPAAGENETEGEGEEDRCRRQRWTERTYLSTCLGRRLNTHCLMSFEAGDLILVQYQRENPNRPIVTRVLYDNSVDATVPISMSGERSARIRSLRSSLTTTGN